MTLKNTHSTVWKTLFAVEKISIVYVCFTALIAVTFGAKDSYAFAMIAYRALFVAAIFALKFWYQRRNTKTVWLVRNLFPLAFIAYWYPETYYMNEHIFGNLDMFFAHADQYLFGCQPSLEFSKCLPQIWINELMNFGYLSYYFIIAATVFIAFVKSRKCMEYAVFVILCSFFIYYATFIILPVTGPQFYFASPENSIPCGGFFRSAMIFLQEMGEKPTGAFPSSHVGICLICMYFIFRYSRKIFYLLVPVAFILICSTVYIKAHYLIDIVGGFASAPIYFAISKKMWKLKFLKSDDF
jgi:membrane-associated phospholipid phosphatase